MHRVIVSLVLSTCLAATALAVLAQAQPAPPAKAPDTRSPPPPMVFYVARGEPGACGPGCQEWIAAEGFIDPNAEPRLWELLRKIGNDRKPPVYFQSNGGSLTPPTRVLKAATVCSLAGVRESFTSAITTNCRPVSAAADEPTIT